MANILNELVVSMRFVHKKSMGMENQLSEPAIKRPGKTLPYEDYFSELRRKEYSRIDDNGEIYLDFTGGNLYPASLVKNHQELLLRHVFGNPHSINPTSKRSSELISQAREKVLDFFNAKNYVCVFTQNATNALRIVGESYPFDENSAYIMLSDNHNSVNGIREYCKRKGGKVIYLPLQYNDLQISEPTLKQLLNEQTKNKKVLFSYPAQSNVTGVKHDLKWVKYAKEKGCDVILDAAAFVPTSRLDLSEIQPDFVPVSFYKIFGYPTGLGCLLIHKDSFQKLKKPWFAGGTVTLVSVNTQDHFLVNTHERFEDGTLNYLGIPAVKTGLEYIESIGMERITERVHAITELLAKKLHDLHHSNGKPLLRIFGPEDFSKRGGNMIMSFYDKNGNTFPTELIEEKASEQNISIRTGCFCNPGVDEINSCVTTEELAGYFTSHDRGDYHDMVAFIGRMRGSVRVSVGFITNENDIDRFCHLISQFKDRSASEFLTPC